MKFSKPFKIKLSLVVGGALGLAAISTASPIQAQTVVACPPGYAFYAGSGCVPAGPGYAAVYGAPVVAVPPVYDTFGLAYGYGRGRPIHHDRGHEHFYDHGYGHGHDDHHH